MRTKHTFRLPPDLGLKLADYASRKRVPQAHVVETALASFPVSYTHLTLPTKRIV